jgi:Mn2+/Fe2+ NRAMP family transporter
MLALLWFASDKRLMGVHRSRSVLLIVAGVSAVCVVALNVLVLWA